MLIAFFAFFADGVKVNQIRVTETDIPATNGAVHVIDTVMLP